MEWDTRVMCMAYSSHKINGSIHGTLHAFFLKDCAWAPQMHGPVPFICALQAPGTNEEHTVAAQYMFTE